jgi:tetratricopeptide (TPR) repeat protein
VKFASYGFSLAAENGGGLLTIAGSFHKNFALAINGDESKLDVAYNSNLQVKEIGFFAFRLQWLSQLIHGYLKFDRLEEAGKCLQEAFDFMKRSEEGFCKPEIFRLQGELFLRQGQPKAAEASYGEAIDIARQQSTKWHELLATKSLARLWQSQGKTAEAYDLLNGVFSWFTEGFDTIDMQEADELLSELAQTRSI